MRAHKPSIRLEPRGALSLGVPRNALLMIFPPRFLRGEMRLNHTKAVIWKTSASTDTYFLGGIENLKSNDDIIIDVAQSIRSIAHLALDGKYTRKLRAGGRGGTPTV